ncbi:MULTISPECIES: ABC transporter permease [Niastella]|uniref:ABC transporter permease n=1 Tax=Niastella soli TaxID=2821487 RepID=A0ABS3YWF2_9BACT|nr:ABC transporter permease [Niastella soli]MBO9202250.1 ABC transporter permease [Niastella soli]
MFKNYWIVAWRTLVRNRIYSLVNVLGLAFGICACLVIYLITRYEYSFDTFHPDPDRIFCVDYVPVKHGAHFNCVPVPLPATMRREITGLQTVAAFRTYSADVTIPGVRNEPPVQFNDDGSLLIAEPQYFDIFQYRWLSGNAATSLSLPNSVVLTAGKARKYFGNLDPDKVIGRTIYYQDSLMVRVTGVVADLTGNSDLNFSQWISYATIPVSLLNRKIKLDDWNKIDGSSQMMVKLAKGVTPAQIDAQLDAIVKQHFGKRTERGALLRPLWGIHFSKDYGGWVIRKADQAALKLLQLAAIFILVLAIVNFVNLSTAQSMQRAREIGVRKVLGGSRSGIAVQFFTETLLMTIAAAALAVLMIRPVFILFADLIPAGVHFRMDGGTLLFLLLVVAATAGLAGFYPAKVLGKYHPTVTLKGITAVPDGGKGELRRGLIVFQFTISLLFIIMSFIMGSQLRYMFHINLGLKTDAVITITPPRSKARVGISMEAQGERKQRKPSEETVKMAVLADKIRQHAGVVQVIKEGAPPVGFMRMSFFDFGLRNNNENMEVSLHYSNEEYVPFYGLKLIAGRNLLPGDSSREVLISEQCAHALGFADVNKVIGREVLLYNEACPVAGVIADFYDASFHRAARPILISHDPVNETVIGVKIAAQQMTASELKTLIGNFEKDWKTVFPGKPFECSFLDEIVAGMYADDLRAERVINVAMYITVFISCLGLLGLTIFSTERRGREIGIRKVLGATVPKIMVMLCKEIVVLIVIAFLIVTPIAALVMVRWLNGYAYHTPLNFLMYFAAGAAAIGVGLLTVGFQAMKAAMANPVKSLRTE